MANDIDTADQDKVPFGKRMKRWLIIGLIVLVGGFIITMMVGTSTYEGQITRAYEKMSEYRVEMETTKGGVRVFVNKESRFPYLKFDTADLQAELTSYARSGDIVRIKSWGFRNSVFSWFPNVIKVSHVRDNLEAKGRKAERIADGVMDVLGSHKMTDSLTGVQRDELREEIIEKVIDVETTP